MSRGRLGRTLPRTSRPPDDPLWYDLDHTKDARHREEGERVGKRVTFHEGSGLVFMARNPAVLAFALMSLAVGCDDSGDRRALSDAPTEEDAATVGSCDWTFSAGGILADTAEAVLALPDGDVVVVGLVRTANTPLGAAAGGFVTRLSSTGTVVWTNVFADTEPLDIDVGHDGRLVVMGTASSTASCAEFHGATDAWLAEVSPADGTLMRSICIGGDDDDSATAVRIGTNVNGRYYQITGTTDSHADGNIGPKHGGGGFDSPDVLYAYFYPDLPIGPANPRGVCFGSSGSEIGVGFLSDGTIVGNTFGADDGDLVGLPLDGASDTLILKPSNFDACSVTTGGCTVSADRLGGNDIDSVLAMLPTGFVAGTTRSTSGQVFCAGEPVWLAKLDATASAYVGQGCLSGGSTTLEDIAELGTSIAIVGTAGLAGDFTDAIRVGTSAPGPGSLGYIGIYDASNFDAPEELVVMLDPKSVAFKGVAIRPDRCVVAVGAAFSPASSDAFVYTRRLPE
ncbi:MAG: hypothetical protein ACKV2T_16860 [Kofleriaceae bacterium]